MHTFSVVGVWICRLKSSCESFVAILPLRTPIPIILRATIERLQGAKTQDGMLALFVFA